MSLLQRFRFRQFSVRFMLVITMAAATLFAFVGWQESERQQLIRDIERVGGSVKYEADAAFTMFQSQRVSDVSLPHDSVRDIGGSRLRKFENLGGLRLLDVEVTSGDMQMRANEMVFLQVDDRLLDHLGTPTPKDTP